MIEKLGFRGERIFETRLSEDKKLLKIREACDFYFETDLTKKQVTELANDFYLLAESMIDFNNSEVNK